MPKLFQKRKITSESGMTFLELIVVMGIFAAISSTVLFSYRSFSANTALQNLAQDVALQVKQAQTDALSGKVPFFSPASNQGVEQQSTQSLIPLDWKPSYGVAFQLDPVWTLGGNGTAKGFAYYFNKGAPPIPPNPEIDRDFYDMTYTSYNGCYPVASADSECLQEIRITSGDIIDMICFDFDNITADCSDGTTGDQAFISFTRPRGNAIIMDGAAQDTGGATPHENVFIRLTSVSGSYKYVAIWASGYIEVK